MNNQEYNLIKVIEECAEVQEACSKILRFGMYSTNPSTQESNLDKLRSELGDLTVAVQLLEENMGLELETSDYGLGLKLDRFLKFRELSVEIGILS